MNRLGEITSGLQLLCLLQKGKNGRNVVLHWRIQHEGYKLRPEDVPAYQQWLAKHPELYKNKHPHK